VFLCVFFAAAMQEAASSSLDGAQNAEEPTEEGAPQCGYKDTIDMIYIFLRFIFDELSIN
jgi:hypothetical protein